MTLAIGQNLPLSDHCATLTPYNTSWLFNTSSLSANSIHKSIMARSDTDSCESSDDDSKIRPTQDYQLDDESLKAYKQLWQRFSRKKTVFNLATHHFRMLETWVFIIPLLFLQIMNATLPNFLGEGTSAPTTSTIAAVSAGWIALQAKTRWGELSQKYENLAGTYNLLVSEAYFKMTQHQIKSSDITKSESDAAMLSFLEYCQNLEKNARAGVPVVPKFIEKKVMNFEARAHIKKIQFEHEKNERERELEEMKVVNDAKQTTIKRSKTMNNKSSSKIGSNLVTPAKNEVEVIGPEDDDVV